MKDFLGSFLDNVHMLVYCSKIPKPYIIMLIDIQDKKKNSSWIFFPKDITCQFFGKFYSYAALDALYIKFEYLLIWGNVLNESMSLKPMQHLWWILHYRMPLFFSIFLHKFCFLIFCFLCKKIIFIKCWCSLKDQCQTPTTKIIIFFFFCSSLKYEKKYSSLKIKIASFIQLHIYICEIVS